MPKYTHSENPNCPESVVRDWINEFVIGLNFCPFAKRVVDNELIRYKLASSDQIPEVLEVFLMECQRLASGGRHETTIVIVHNALSDFIEYNNTLSVIDELIFESGLEGTLQIASFHPDYQFADSSAKDITNYTNRSPYPLFHILREDSVTQALSVYPNPERIPERNQSRLASLGMNEILERYHRVCTGKK